MNLLEKMEFLEQEGLLHAVETEFSRFLYRLDPHVPESVIMAAALAVRKAREGHVCLQLDHYAGRPVFAEEYTADTGPELKLPPLEEWKNALEQSTFVGPAGTHRPLVLDEGRRLYLQKYFEYEARLAQRLREKALKGNTGTDAAKLGDHLRRYFPDSGEQPDWQEVAALTAATRNLAVISGGPGTGKTSTVVKILALLLEQAQDQEALKMGLAAPTGKAAARLTESIAGAKETLPAETAVKALIPENAVTIHRLLGARHQSTSFRYNRERPLPLDVLVVDEASMVDLALMSKLLDAVPEQCRLILLGDRHQLASVEAGAVLGDICAGKTSNSFSSDFVQMAREAGIGLEEEAGEKRQPLGDSIVLLQRSYRFGTDSGIGRLAAAVNEADTGTALSLLHDPSYPDVVLRQFEEEQALEQALDQLTTPYIERYLEAPDARQALQRFNELRILCAHRRGPLGVESVNRSVEQRARHLLGVHRSQPWFRGRPVMITRNDYSQRLRNGDMGLALMSGNEQEGLKVAFAGEDGEIRMLSPARLPEHETVFATTVHKSQGSEYDKVVLILPARISRVTTRELIYTAITRARTGIEIWGSGAVFREAIQKNIERSTGLHHRLWPHQGGLSIEKPSPESGDGQLDMFGG